ncbi:acyl-CoA dehydrogenase family protein [Thermodesulfobacteriota bacterium]
MDFTFGEKEERLRAEIREFVKESFLPGHIGYMFEEEHADETWEFAMSISKKLAQKGWLTMSWPKEHGGMGASVTERVVYGEEAGYWGIPGVGMGVSGTAWVGPSLMIFGTEEQRKKYLPPIAAGEPDGVWCTGYSEPDAGSDFANLQTRADKKGDEYVVNGQKVWTSAGHRARWCWLACRTDPTATRKHHGISILIVDMQSPGVTVRPLKNYVGFHFFNEIFFNDVKVPVSNLVGEENKGWYHLMQALAFERGVAVGTSGTSQRLLEELVNHANETGTIKDPVVRRTLADLVVDIRSLRILAYEAAWKMSKGMTVIYEPARDKANNDLLLEKLSRVATGMLGAYSQIDPLHKDPRWIRLKGVMEHIYWMCPGMCIAAGTTDTVRNIVGQFGLNLPRSY